MISKINAGLKKISESYEIEKTFVVFLQGESNALIQTPEKDYRDMLIMFKNALKSAVDFEKFAIIRVGYFAEFAPWIKLPKRVKKKADKIIMKAQENRDERHDANYQQWQDKLCDAIFCPIDELFQPVLHQPPGDRHGDDIGYHDLDKERTVQ